MFPRRWLDKITLRSWSFLLFVDSLSSWAHSLQTDSHPWGMYGVNWAVPFISQALPDTDTIALLSLLIQTGAGHWDKCCAEMKTAIPADQLALPYALQTLTQARRTVSAPMLGKSSFLFITGPCTGCRCCPVPSHPQAVPAAAQLIAGARLCAEQTKRHCLAADKRGHWSTVWAGSQPQPQSQSAIWGWLRWKEKWAWISCCTLHPKLLQGWPGPGDVAVCVSAAASLLAAHCLSDQLFSWLYGWTNCS